MLWSPASIQRLVYCYCCFEAAVGAVEVSVYTALSLLLSRVYGLLVVLRRSLFSPHWFTVIEKVSVYSALGYCNCCF